MQSLEAIADGALEQGLRALVPWDRQRALDDLAPARLDTPLGSAAIDYAAEGGPRVDIRVQELFGVTCTGRRAGDSRLRVSGTRPLPAPSVARRSDAGRTHHPRQTARDLTPHDTLSSRW